MVMFTGFPELHGKPCRAGFTAWKKNDPNSFWRRLNIPRQGWTSIRIACLSFSVYVRLDKAAIFFWNQTDCTHLRITCRSPCMRTICLSGSKRKWPRYQLQATASKKDTEWCAVVPAI